MGLRQVGRGQNSELLQVHSVYLEGNTAAGFLASLQSVIDPQYISRLAISRLDVADIPILNKALTVFGHELCDLYIDVAAGISHAFLGQFLDQYSMPCMLSLFRVSTSF